MKKCILLTFVLALVTQVNGQDKAQKFETAIQEPKVTQQTPVAELANTNDSLPKSNFKHRFYYGYNFDIYYHNDTKDRRKENGWSFSVTPEFGYKISEKVQVGLRLGGTYASQRGTYYTKNDKGVKTESNLLVRSGSWEVAPYGRYRLKTLFNNVVGIWVELHGYTSMTFPQIIEGDPSGTDFYGLKHVVNYGAQLSPLITINLNEKRTFNIFFSILSLGYSGATRVYKDASGNTSKEYSNDVILFSGKLGNLIANQFTPGLYGIKFGIQKQF